MKDKSISTNVKLKCDTGSEEEVYRYLDQIGILDNISHALCFGDDNDLNDVLTQLDIYGSCH